MLTNGGFTFQRISVFLVMDVSFMMFLFLHLGSFMFYLCPFMSLVLGIRDLVPGTRYQVPGTRYQVPGTRYLVPGARYQVLGIKYQVLSTLPGTSSKRDWRSSVLSTTRTCHGSWPNQLWTSQPTGLARDLSHVEQCSCGTHSRNCKKKHMGRCNVWEG